jgi:2-methylcitrate dehydratase
MKPLYRLAENVNKARFEDLPPDVIHQTKRVILDTLGCAIGGYESDTSMILQDFVLTSNDFGNATIFGTGLRSSCMNAALVNGAMVRYLDYNDTAFLIKNDTYRSGYHPSEVIAPILALGEHKRSCGKEVISAVNVGYDLSYSFFDGIVGAGIEKRGWNADSRGAYIMPLVAGKIMDLNVEQAAQAVGISGSFFSVLGILDAPSEEYSMSKNIRFPMMSYGGILAAMLAERGFTGPGGILEGEDGVINSIMDGEYDVEKLIHFLNRFSIRDTCIKSLIGDYSSHGHLTATLKLVKDYDLRPEDIDKIKITTSKRCAEHTGNPIKKFPNNKETADHSAYFLTAIAIVDREIGPGQFTKGKYEDPLVHDLINKVIVVGDENLDRERPAGISEIKAKNGKTFRLKITFPKGHVHNQMSDQEIIWKFREMASRYMNEEKIERIIEMTFNLEKISEINALIKLLCFEEP